MSDGNNRGPERKGITRREFMTTTAGAVAGSYLGLMPGGAWGKGGKPKYGGSIKIGTRDDVSRLDPHWSFPPYPTSQSLALLYNGLTEIDYNTNIVPGLAESWEISKDGKTYLFNIRKGVTFHNGKTMTAKDAKANIERVLNPKTGASVRSQIGPIIDSMETPGKYQLKIQLKKIFAPFLVQLTNRWLPILDPDIFDTVNEKPIGTGPFKYVSWKRKDTHVMHRHKDYWEEGLPYLDEIIGKPLPDATVRYTALRTGDVDMIESLDYKDQTSFLKEYSDRFDTYRITALGTIWFTFNCQRPPFDDKRVRQAIALAVDKEQIKKSTLFGHGEVMDQFYTKSSPWYLPQIKHQERDPDKARSLLKAANYPMDREIDIIGYVKYDYIKNGYKVLQSNLNEIGLKSKIRAMDWGALVGERKKRNFDLFGLGSAYRMDADTYYYKEYHSESIYNKTMMGNWSNARYDRLVEEARNTLDMAKRKELYAEGVEIINEEVPKFWSISAHNLSAWRNQLKGYRPCVAGHMTYKNGGFRTAWLDE